MNRKKKLIFIGVLAIAYIVIALNFHRIKFGLSMLKLYSTEKNQETIIDNTEDKTEDDTGSIVDNPLEIIIQGGNIVDKDDDSGDNGDDSVAKTEDDDNHRENPTVKDDSKNSYIDIIKDYNIELENLRSTFEKELNGLISEGMEEYSKGQMSTTQLAGKYLSSGSTLEKSSDNKFDAVVKEMEKELKKNNHSTDIIKEVKDYYYDFKNAKKTALINRGMKHVR